MLVPLYPGVLCALGCAIADLRYDESQTIERRLDQIGPGELAGDFRAPARPRARHGSSESDIAVAEIGFSHVADMAYLGPDPLPAGAGRARLGPERMAEAFARALRAGVRQHARRHPVVVVNAADDVDRHAPPGAAGDASGSAPARGRRRSSAAPSTSAAGTTRRSTRRDDLAPGHRLDGPAVVEQSGHHDGRRARHGARRSTRRQSSCQGEVMDPVTLAVVRGTFEQIARRDGPPSHPRRDLADHLRDERLRERDLPRADRGDDRAGPLRPAGLPRLHAVRRAGVIEEANSQGGFRAGDVWIMNDAYLGGSHLQDVQLVAPHFVDGKLFALMADDRPLDGHRRQRARRLGARRRRKSTRRASSSRRCGSSRAAASTRRWST